MKQHSADLPMAERPRATYAAAMSDKKSFTGWVERPVWERTLLVLLIAVSVIGLWVAYVQSR